VLALIAERDLLTLVCKKAGEKELTISYEA
jgi:hypothetical protein